MASLDVVKDVWLDGAFVGAYLEDLHLDPYFVEQPFEEGDCRGDTSYIDRPGGIEVEVISAGGHIVVSLHIAVGVCHYPFA